MICYSVYQELDRNTQQTKKKKQKQRQQFKKIGIQLPLAEDRFISHSVYKCQGNVNCLIVKVLC